ncbi:MAG: PIN domain-containing protein, partial [Terriglobales bacterium]
MSRVYWDTMLFIYWLEDHPAYARRVDTIRSRMEERHDQLITGTFTFGEVLAGIYRKGTPQLADETRRLLRSVVAEVVPFTLETADHY